MVYIVIVDWYGWRDTIECLDSVFEMDWPSFRVVVCCNSDPAEVSPTSLPRIEGWARGQRAGGSGEAAYSGAPDAPAGMTLGIVPPRLAHAGSTGVTGVEGNGTRLTLIDIGANLGFAGANNVGIRYALAQGDCDYVWLLNNDTRVDTDSLGALVRLAEDRPSAGMVGSKLLDYRKPDVLQAAAGGKVVPWCGFTSLLGNDESDVGQWDEVREVEYVTGASLLARADMVHQIGLLDERYFLYAEEVDWCVTARTNGWNLLYAPDSRVWHKGGESVGYGSPLHDYYTVRSMLLLVQKFSPALLPLTFGYSLYRCLAPKLVRMQPARIRAVLRAYRDFASMSFGRNSPSPPAHPAAGSHGCPK